MRTVLRLAVLALLLSACSSDEAPVESPEDELASLAMLDGKADGSSQRTLVGTGVAYEQVNIGEGGSVQLVYAHDPVAGYSHYASFEKQLAADYAPKSTAFEVSVDSTGCNTGATWCLHDVLVTHRPHDPTTYDLALDYTDFTDRPVTDDYF